MMKRSLRFALLLAGLAMAQAGCVSVDVGMGTFMSPDRAPRTATLAQGYTVQDAVIVHGDRRIGITHAHHPKSRAAILFCGGNTFRRAIVGGDVLAALAREADVLIFDYPGHGETTGAATAAGILETALAAYDHLTGLPTSAGKKRVVYGFSLGGMVAAQLARQRTMDGVVLEATAPDVASWARSQIPWYARGLVRTRIDPELASIDAIDTLEEFEGDVLVLSGEADEQAPAALSETLHRELRRAGVESTHVSFPRARHGEIATAATFQPVLHDFLTGLEGSR